MGTNTPGSITPYFPVDAMAVARIHQNKNNQPVFTWSVNISDEPGECPNCGGNGEIYMRLAERGPYSFVPGSKNAVTWYDGDGQFPKGWYVIQETMAFPCPKCQVTVKPSSPMKP
jgi:hypothetical protein